MAKDSLPKSQIARLTVVGKTAASMGSKKAQFLMKKSLVSKDKKQNLEQNHQDEMAEVLFKGLSKLRGTALKIAQSVCAETGVLPSHYLAKLEKSCYQVPPLNRAVVRKVIKDNLGDEPEKLFNKFDATAFAAASLGQVHRAEGKNGEALAVKVQYPGIGDTIQSDLNLAKNLIAPIRKNKLAKQTFDEIRKQLELETDYHQELKNTQWFYDNLKVEGIGFPKTFPQYSGTKVLATEFIEGHHLSEWLNTKPPQEKINRAAQSLWSFFWISLNKHLIIHSDPNLGNYLFLEDGSIKVIDFGSVKKTPLMVMETFNLLWGEQSSDDQNNLLNNYRSLGAQFDDSKKNYFFEKMIQPYWTWKESLPNQFKQNDQYSANGQQILNQSAFAPEMQGFSTHFTMIHRSLFGLIQIFQKMEAHIELQQRPL